MGVSTSFIEIFTDGGARGNPGPGASAFVVLKGKTKMYQQSYYFKNTTNNVAEYFAVLMAVSWLEKNIRLRKNEKVIFNLDSELVVKQLNGLYKTKNEKLKSINTKILKVIKNIKADITINHIPRKDNSVADFLVNEKIDENI